MDYGIKESIMTPFGEVKFLAVNKPDKNGKHRAVIVVDKKEADDFLVKASRINKEVYEDTKKEGKLREIKFTRNEISERQPDGTWKSVPLPADKVAIELSKSTPIKVFDATGKNPVTKMVGNGSIVRLQACARPTDNKKYGSGAMWMLGLVQVKELVEFKMTGGGTGLESVEGYVETDAPFDNDAPDTKVEIKAGDI